MPSIQLVTSFKASLIAEENRYCSGRQVNLDRHSRDSSLWSLKPKSTLYYPDQDSVLSPMNSVQPLCINSRTEIYLIISYSSNLFSHAELD